MSAEVKGEGASSVSAEVKGEGGVISVCRSEGGGVHHQCLPK